MTGEDRRAEEDEDGIFDRMDAILRRAMEGEDVRDSVLALPEGAARRMRTLLRDAGLHDGSSSAPASPPSSGSAIASRFLAAWYADEAQGRRHPLEHYLALFPGDAAAVARVWLAAERSGGAAGETAGATRMVGPYEIMGDLGRGAQAVVHRARDLRLGREVALKVFEGSGHPGEAAFERFRREAAFAARLEHPGICKVIEAGVADGRPYIAMELVAGETIATRIRREAATGGPSVRREDLRAKARVMAQAARALHYAHEAGVIHRDLKPANLMLRPDGAPVILDFGLAKVADPEWAAVTGSQDFVGTPAYIAPERLRTPGLAADRREDVHALGVTLHEWLALERPFQGATVDLLHRAILDGSCRPLDQALPGFPRDLARIVSTAIKVDPRERYASAAALADDLERFLAGRPVSVRPIGRVVRAWRWTQRNATVAASGVAVILALLTALGVFVAKNRRIERLRGESESRATALARSLAEVEELAERKKLRDLEAEADRLWPAEPRLLERLRAWEREFDAVASRLPHYEASLRELGARERPYDEAAMRADWPEESAELSRLEAEDRRLEQAIDGAASDDQRRAAETELDLIADRLDALRAMTAKPKSTRFATITDSWRHDALLDLVAEIKRQAEPARGLEASVRARTALASRLERDSILDAAPAWQRAADAVMADRRFASFRLAPQMGLLPLGPDPESGLQEFLHLATQEGPPLPRAKDGKLATDPHRGVVLVLLPGGSFLMGSADDPADPDYEATPGIEETPRHEVVLAPFFCAKFELTQAQWMKCGDENPSTYKAGFVPPAGPKVTLSNPVETVSWRDARRVLQRMGLELPTEAQWEYAARGGRTSRWSTGNDRESLRGAANLADKSAAQSGWETARDWPDLDDGHLVHAEVGRFRPNPFGLHDMHGNVLEWCLDHLGPYAAPVRPGDGLRLGKLDDRNRVFRGGAYVFTAWHARSAMRYRDNLEGGVNSLGLRAVRAVESR